MTLRQRLTRLEGTRPATVNPGEGARKLKEFIDRIAERQRAAPDWVEPNDTPEERAAKVQALKVALLKAVGRKEIRS
ncbi:hypothetical protein T8T21_14125 [Limimaricola variabilis]|uniref:hypothetical protein n=1 Tax=Limimaricola variabilis TaxID=1492771 RepID=UPI002AC9910B|nr:hypothetical protein [Limimaricola variabilis]WPY94228.1 hypothetical protein T8T21_14125 [Limimaricola variabilis]